jgi:hypothetical protein
VDAVTEECGREAMTNYRDIQAELRDITEQLERLSAAVNRLASEAEQDEFERKYIHTNEE